MLRHVSKLSGTQFFDIDPRDRDYEQQPTTTTLRDNKPDNFRKFVRKLGLGSPVDFEDLLKITCPRDRLDHFFYNMD
jgi:hypothetical protein